LVDEIRPVRDKVKKIILNHKWSFQLITCKTPPQEQGRVDTKRSM
jgi:hypothetical protein